jgi:hypothetical protein
MAEHPETRKTTIPDGKKRSCETDCVMEGDRPSTHMRHFEERVASSNATPAQDRTIGGTETSPSSIITAESAITDMNGCSSLHGDEECNCSSSWAQNSTRLSGFGRPLASTSATDNQAEHNGASSPRHHQDTASLDTNDKFFGSRRSSERTDSHRSSYPSILNDLHSPLLTSQAPRSEAETILTANTSPSSARLQSPVPAKSAPYPVELVDGIPIFDTVPLHYYGDRRLLRPSDDAFSTSDQRNAYIWLAKYAISERTSLWHSWRDQAEGRESWSNGNRPIFLDGVRRDTLEELKAETGRVSNAIQEWETKVRDYRDMIADVMCWGPACASDPRESPEATWSPRPTTSDVGMTEEHDPGADEYDSRRGELLEQYWEFDRNHQKEYEKHMKGKKPIVPI